MSAVAFMMVALGFLLFVAVANNSWLAIWNRIKAAETRVAPDLVAPDRQRGVDPGTAPPAGPIVQPVNPNQQTPA